MADAQYIRGRDDVRVTAAAAVASGEVWQLKDGRAAVYDGLNAAASSDRVKFTTTGQFTFTKAASVVLLDGGRAYWDHSANAVTYKKVNDRDFYLGRVVGDAASADTACAVNLNVDPPYDIDVVTRDGALSVATGTAAAGGFGLPTRYGSSIGLSLTATSEAQCVDVLSVDRFALGANAIAEFIVRLGANGSTSAVDLSIGVANGTSTTDADAITESLFFHIDGGALDIFAESDDGTTEVAATDTTVDITAGSAVANRFEFWIDMRDPSDCKFYINGAEVLAATANLGNVAVAAGPLGLLVHLEKTTGTATAGPVYIDAMRARLSEQNAS
jgi:predicted RecA/RadA family phage recombinase